MVNRVVNELSPTLRSEDDTNEMNEIRMEHKTTEKKKERKEKKNEKKNHQNQVHAK